MNMYINNVPEAMQREFKARCVLAGISIRDAIIGFMKSYVKDNRTVQAREKADMKA